MVEVAGALEHTAAADLRCLGALGIPNLKPHKANALVLAYVREARKGNHHRLFRLVVDAQTVGAAPHRID